MTYRILILLLILIFSPVYAAASVSDIDDDVIANVTFQPSAAGTIHGVNITWTAPYSGYLYWYFFKNNHYGTDLISPVTGDLTGVYISIADSLPFGETHPVYVYRMGYVYNGTQYNLGGHIQGISECGSDWLTSVPLNPAYSGGYTGSIVNMYSIDTVCGDWQEYKALLIEADPPVSTLSGYVTNNLGNDVSSAVVELNNSGGSDTADDYGYYEITGITAGTYSITVTSPTHTDYSDTISITSDIEKNITLTRLTPTLSNIDKTTTKTDVWIRWTRNMVTDTIKIYKDSNTRLYTMAGGGSYIDENLACDKGYVYWLQPMDGDIAGPKYRIDAKTRSCDGGSGGGGGGGGGNPGGLGEGDPETGLDPIIIPTPGLTPPPGTNLTQEEWLNLTLEEQQQILINLTLMQQQLQQQQPFKAWLTIHKEDLASWTSWLFIGICAAISIDSITIQKISKYIGIVAVIPGIYFAYLAGFL